MPRSYEAFVYGRVKFRVGSIVWLSFSGDETVMGFSFPKEFREALVESEPEKFMFSEPVRSSLQLGACPKAALEPDDMRELVLDA